MFHRVCVYVCVRRIRIKHAKAEAIPQRSHKDAWWMNGEVFLCNQSSRQGSVQMLFVVPKQIRHAAISLQDFRLTVCLALYSCCLAYTCSCSLPPILSDHGDLQQSYGMKNKVGWFLCIFIHLSRCVWKSCLTSTDGTTPSAWSSGRVGPSDRVPWFFVWPVTSEISELVNVQNLQ